MRSLLNILIIAAFTCSLAGCATVNKKLRALFGKDQKEEQVAEVPHSSNPRFSEVDSYKVGTERQYKRMNKEQFEAEAQVGDSAGSLWVMEGQGAYLFAQNTKRLVGDFVNINIEGPPAQQLQTKTNVIAKLLKRLEHGEAPAPTMRRPASTQKVAQDQANGKNPAQKAEGDQNQQNNAQNDQNGNPQAGEQKPAFEVTQVPARIVETLKDGSYRVKGSQQFMIGKREYKVIVTGIVRPEDFNEDGTSATKILDGQFDIVSNKKGIATL